MLTLKNDNNKSFKNKCRITFHENIKEDRQCKSRPDMRIGGYVFILVFCFLLNGNISFFLNTEIYFLIEA